MSASQSKFEGGKRTIIEASTGPLITHQMAALSFMSQHLKEKTTTTENQPPTAGLKSLLPLLPDVIKMQPQHRPDGYAQGRRSYHGGSFDHKNANENRHLGVRQPHPSQ